MKPSPEKAAAASVPEARCRILLPAVDGTDWFIDVPASLIGCIGRYARIPEFAKDGPILPVWSLSRGLGR